MSTFRDILALAGVGVTVLGVFQWSTAAGLVVLGLAIVGGSIAWSLTHGSSRSDRQEL